MHHVCFVLHPRFQMLAYVLASETLRIANRRAGQPLFTWKTRTATGIRILASNGRAVDPDATGWGETRRAALVLVIAGYDPLAVRPAGLAAFLRRADRQGSVLGGVDTGVSVLASCGLLRRGHRFVMHREAVAGFAESWPDLPPEDSGYAIDGNRMSAAGGTATGDAILAWISSLVSPEFAQDVAGDMAHGSIRPATGRQGIGAPRDPLMQTMRDEMQATIAAPVEIAALASRLGLSIKQLRRRCLREFGKTPQRFFLDLRLIHARDLLHMTRMPVTEVAIAAGFGSSAGFGQAFKRFFGVTPTTHRRSGSGSVGDLQGRD